MSTYSTVDTILTPSLIDISPITDPEINRGVLQSIDSDTQLSISPIPGKFPPAVNGQGIPVITISSEPNREVSQLNRNQNMQSNINSIIQSPSLALLSDQSSNDVISPLVNGSNYDELQSSPIETVAYGRKICKGITTEEVMACLRKTRLNNNGLTQEQFPTKNLPSIPAFAPPKNISIDVATNSTLKDQLKDKNVSVRQTALTLLEKKIITMQGKCPDSIVDNLRTRIFQLDPATISEYLGSYGRYDHDYQDGMGCLIDALISNEDVLPDIRLRRWITDVNRIGGASAEGMAFLLSSDTSKLDYSNKLESSPYPLYVIKIAADPTIDTLPHEALVGMGAINKVRDRVPNFMHTYGAFMCAPPIIDSSGSIVSWCPSKANGITYLVLENIQDAVSLKSLAWDLSDAEFLQIYLQILNSLNVAYKEFDFTHYDLHDGNVLIQILPYDVSVPLYTQDGGVYYIRTRHLARIIDYGMSHIYLQGQHFGKYQLEFAGVSAESSFPMHDAYKILLFTYASSLQRKKDNMDEIRTSSGITPITSGIYEFFNEGKSINTRVQERKYDPWGDYYQPSESYKNITFDDLISFIISKYRLDFITSDQSPDAIATICQDVCVGWNSFTQHIFNKSKLPITLEDYCQAQIAINKLSNNQARKDLTKWIRQFNVENAYETEKAIFVDKLNNSIQELNSVSLLTVDNPIFNYQLYKTHLQTLIKVQYQLLNVQLWLEAVSCAFNHNSNDAPNQPLSSAFSGFSYISNDLIQLTQGLNAARQRLVDYQTIIKFNIKNDINSSFLGEIAILHNILITPLS